jgi:hypothetical protein
MFLVDGYGPRLSRTPKWSMAATCHAVLKGVCENNGCGGMGQTLGTLVNMPIIK